MNSTLVAICTFNPDENLLREVLDSIHSSKCQKRVLLIDNGSSSNVSNRIANDYAITLIQLEKPGISKARYEAMRRQKDNELLVFVDDDNVLADGYLDTAIEIANANPLWGAFAGILEKPQSYQVRAWIKPFLAYFAIKNLGQNSQESFATLHWTILEPPTAGAAIRPEVSAYLVNQIANGNLGFFHVGAIGNRQLRGEDSYLVRQCFHLGLKWGYDPRLSLEHKFDSKRLSLKYLSKLLYGMGYSDVYLDLGLGVEPQYPYPRTLADVLTRTIYATKNTPWHIFFIFRYLGQYRANVQLSKN